LIEVWTKVSHPLYRGSYVKDKENAKEVTPKMTNIFSIWNAHLNSAADYFQIASFDEVRTHARMAVEDSILASKSIYVFLKLVTRPILILIGLVSHCLWVGLRILIQCTVEHGYIALRETCKSIIQFQSGLSRAAIVFEIGFVWLLILLYTIRRYIKKKRYVERVLSWYRKKRSKVLKKYDIFVDNVAQTSMVLALLLPHILYCSVAVSLKYFAPKLVQYLATKTILTSCISVYYPVLKTLLVIHRWVDVVAMTITTPKTTDDDSSMSKKLFGNGWGFISIFQKKKSGVADKYLQVAAKNTSQVSKKKTALSKDQGSVIEGSQRFSEDEIVKVVKEQLKYWVVYSFLSAMFLTFSLLPVIGRILSKASGPAVSHGTSTRWRQSRVSFLGKIKLSKEFIDELKMAFFVWLNLLPTSITKGDVGAKHAKTKTAKKNQVAGSLGSRMKLESFSNQPLEIVYKRISLLALSVVQSSNSLKPVDSNVTVNSDGKNESRKSIMSKVISSCSSLFDAMVWVNLISNSTKSRVISILTECVDLLPAAITLLMPSYFTCYGLIYVRLVVPVSNSVRVLHVLNTCSKDNTTVNLTQDLSRVIRYLRYWVIHFIFISLLKSFTPILNWIPMATHMQWIFWAYVQLESSTLYLYDVFEYELMAFGFLNVHVSDDVNGHVELDVNDTVVVKVFQSILKRLPSGSVNLDDNSKDLNTVDSNMSSKRQDMSNTLASSQSEKSICINDENVKTNSKRKVSKGKDKPSSVTNSENVKTNSERNVSEGQDKSSSVTKSENENSVCRNDENLKTIPSSSSSKASELPNPKSNATN